MIISADVSMGHLSHSGTLQKDMGLVVVGGGEIGIERRCQNMQGCAGLICCVCDCIEERDGGQGD